MTEQKLTELLRHAYHWGRDNGSNRSERNFNDFLQTEAVQQALSITNVVGRSEQLKALEDLKDFAYDNCQPHNSDRLAEIMERL